MTSDSGLLITDCCHPSHRLHCCLCCFVCFREKSQRLVQGFRCIGSVCLKWLYSNRSVLYNHCFPHKLSEIGEDSENRRECIFLFNIWVNKNRTGGRRRHYELFFSVFSLYMTSLSKSPPIWSMVSNTVDDFSLHFLWLCSACYGFYCLLWTDMHLQSFCDHLRFLHTHVLCGFCSSGCG